MAQRRKPNGQFAAGGGAGKKFGGKMGPSDSAKIRNAEIMYGTGSKQHRAAKKRFGG